LADLTAYQPGAVVSRTLVKKNAGTVTLFAFDVGQGLSEHSAPFAPSWRSSMRGRTDHRWKKVAARGGQAV